jgi:hypothetical protein
VTGEEFAPRTTAPVAMHTRAHAAALFVACESQLRMVADSPDASDGQKELDLLQAVPSCWDETRILNGVPSQYITIARRRGHEWFAGSVTAWDARPLDVPLSFPGSGAYQAEIYSDGANAAAQPKGSVLERRRVDAGMVLKLKLAPGGGSAIRLVFGALTRIKRAGGSPAAPSGKLETYEQVDCRSFVGPDARRGAARRPQRRQGSAGRVGSLETGDDGEGYRRRAEVPAR